MLSRRSFNRSVVLGAAALGAASMRVHAKPEKNRITLFANNHASFNHLPLTIAAQLGYFKAEGLDVVIHDPVESETTVKPDVYCGAYTNIIRMQAQKSYFRAFTLQGLGPLVALGVAAKTFPEYRQPVDLRGKRIGVANYGAMSAVLTNLVLARAKLGVRDVSLVGLSSAQNALDAMRSGQIDAISHCDPVMSALEQRGEIKVISDARTLKGAQQVFGGTMPAACLYASQEFVQSNPGTCQALTDGLVRALKWLQTAGPSDIIKTVPEPYLLGDRGLYLATFARARESFASDGMLSEEAARTALRALTESDAGLKNSGIQLDRTYTNEFALRAKARFYA
jgi:NitT/TauT family transport system substrate-binding protein